MLVGLIIVNFLSLIFINFVGIFRLSSIRYWNFLITFVIFFLSIVSFLFFNKFNFGFFVSGWISDFFFGVDGLSIFFFCLSSLLLLICVLLSWSLWYRLREYLTFLVFLHFMLYIVFATLNLFLFYIFFEVVLVPMFLIIGIWGSRFRKHSAAYRFLFYTVISSIFMLISLFNFFMEVGSFDIRFLWLYEISYLRQIIIWLTFFLAFAVKIPLFPIYGWLPEAHVEAPTGGSIILAGILLKLGCYGLIRFLLSCFGAASHFFSPLVFTICVLGIFFGGCSMLVAFDLKKIIAYSSIVHMSFVVLGLFTFTFNGLCGAMFLILSHGIVSGALFFSVGVLYERYNLRSIFSFGGLARVMPLFSTFFFVFLLANISFPGTSAFAGEFLILCGLIQVQPMLCILCLFFVTFSTVRMFWLGTKILFGPLRGVGMIFGDLTRKEFHIFLILLFLVIYFGVRPEVILDLYSVVLFLVLWQLGC